MSLHEKLARRASKAGLVLSDQALRDFEAYFELLAKWNQRLSLTSLPVRDAGDEALDRLLIEPALAARHLPAPDVRVIDIGSGGGSPAIPLKLAAPGISLRMVESKTRKAAFLREAVRQLRLGATAVEATRFEELLVRPELHDWADVLTMRAVKIDAKTLIAIQSFVKRKGLVYVFTTTLSEARLPTPQLTYTTSYPLISHLGSRLNVFQKIS